MNRLYQIDDVLARFNYGQTSNLLNMLVKQREELEIEIDFMYENGSEDEEGDEEVIQILEDQLLCLDQNILTFRDALLIHENMINQFKLIDEVRCRICFN